VIKIAREFDISIDARSMEMRSLVEVIRFYLEGKTYILILDDVWEKGVWINIMDVFPSNSTSRIVLTSRKHEVALLATSDCAIKLEPLGEDHSWNLFRKLAFQNNDDKRMSSELEYLAVKVLQKCEGLPIAIACIGRLLSCKPTSYSSWKIVYEDLELQSSKNVIPGVDVILKVSLEDLPFELKNCFLHCAIFPEDYEMKRRRLIRHWITAGFIEEKENQTMEEVAERCLNELVNRSLLQVVKKNGFGRVKCCRMHDAVRQLALDRAEKECFGIYEGSWTFSVDGTRRLSIQSSNIGPLSQSGPANFRAIHVFTNYIDIDLLRPILASSMLSTLDLQGTQLKMLPDEVFSLFNLRFLGLRNTGIEILPEAVGRLQNLVVLDALGTCLLYLPKNVAKLKKLRFLYACAVLIEGNLRRYDGVKVPRGIGNLTSLRALQNVKAIRETLCDVATLTELRTFAVCDLKSEHSSNLCSAILNMSHLVHLSIAASNENEVLPMEALRLPKTLSILELEGQLEKNRMRQILSSWSHLHNLTRLSLISSKLDEDSFASFAVLRNLCFLDLSKAYDGKKLNFCAALSFPRLRQLRVCDAPHLNQVKIEGALENLAELVFSDCPELNSLPDGIEHLTTLEELCLLDTADELIEELRQGRRGNQCSEELMKISHIRKVVVRLSDKNIWERIH
jgi:disease resistance protein RPM1